MRYLLLILIQQFLYINTLANYNFQLYLYPLQKNLNTSAIIQPSIQLNKIFNTYLANKNQSKIMQIAIGTLFFSPMMIINNKITNYKYEDYMENEILTNNLTFNNNLLYSYYISRSITSSIDYIQKSNTPIWYLLSNILIESCNPIILFPFINNQNFAITAHSFLYDDILSRSIGIYFNLFERQYLFKIGYTSSFQNTKKDNLLTKTKSPNPANTTQNTLTDSTKIFSSIKIMNIFNIKHILFFDKFIEYHHKSHFTITPFIRYHINTFDISLGFQYLYKDQKHSCDILMNLSLRVNEDCDNCYGNSYNNSISDSNKYTIHYSKTKSSLKQNTPSNIRKKNLNIKKKNANNSNTRKKTSNRPQHSLKNSVNNTESIVVRDLNEIPIRL
ncbi:MAG: hypothetical protein AAFO15_01195 [Pseudomonadota bacterium]